MIFILYQKIDKMNSIGLNYQRRIFMSMNKIDAINTADSLMVKTNNLITRCDDPAIIDQAKSIREHLKIIDAIIKISDGPF